MLYIYLIFRVSAFELNFSKLKKDKFKKLYIYKLDHRTSVAENYVWKFPNLELSLIWWFLQQIKAIADSGCTVVVSGGKVGELAQHFCNKYKLLVVRLMSKWDLRRLCRSVGATPLPRIVRHFDLTWTHCFLVSYDML